MIDRERLLQLMSSVRSKVDARMRSQVAEILSLCEKYRYLGEKFTFDKSEELDKEVNRILVTLTDLVLADIDIMLNEEIGDEDDRQALILYAKRTVGSMDGTQRMDSYGSHLKYLLEGWLAVGFYNKLNIGEIQSNIFSYMKNPFASMEWKEAFRSGLYDSQIITEGGFGYGKGVRQSPLDGMTVTGQGMLNDAYQMGMIEGFKRLGAIGYRVHRGSTYQCAPCDELCVGIHPITEMVLPAHPNCCCYATPVFLGDDNA